MPTGFGSFVFETSAGAPWIWSLSQPYGARDWWPCRDHPLDKVDSMDILVTLPGNLKVGSNGRLAGVLDAGPGLHTYHWQTRYPISTYLVSVTAGPFVEFSDWFRTGDNDSLQILNYVLPGSYAVFRPALAKTVQMLGVFTTLFGPYPFLREKYGHSQFGIGGAMEHQTMTSTTTPEEDVLAHELAHQWFGDMITCASWQHLWLNEGFATYSEALYREQAYGPDEYRRLMDDRMDRALGFSGTLFASDTSSVRELFDSRGVYSKGASVLHMLRGVLGDSLFFRSLGAYAGDAELQYGSATTEDFQRTCENVMGVDLDWFFREWVYGENYPQYLITWETVDHEHDVETTLRIRQQTFTTNPLYFTMPVDARLRGGSGDTTFRLWNDREDQSWSLRTPFRPTSVSVDPDRWILRDVLEESTLPVQLEVDPNFPNPFNAGTTISFRLPARARVDVRIFDVLGAEVATLADRTFEPGQHALRWEGVDHSGTPVGSGPYFCRITSGASRITHPMMLLR
jgi:aminopeptidase N